MKRVKDSPLKYKFSRSINFFIKGSNIETRCIGSFILFGSFVFQQQNLLHN